MKNSFKLNYSGLIDGSHYDAYVFDNKLDFLEKSASYEQLGYKYQAYTNFDILGEDNIGFILYVSCFKYVNAEYKNLSGGIIVEKLYSNQFLTSLNTYLTKVLTDSNSFVIYSPETKKAYESDEECNIDLRKLKLKRINAL